MKYLARHIKLLTFLAIFVLSFSSVYANEPKPPQPPTDCPECILVNSKPGVSAPGQKGRWINGLTPKTVTSPRGGGDAYFWIVALTPIVGGQARTWLNQGRDNHTACARVDTLIRGGDNVGSNIPACPYIAGGQETSAGVWTSATCGTILFVYTGHSLARNAYYWYSADQDVASGNCY